MTEETLAPVTQEPVTTVAPAEPQANAEEVKEVKAPEAEPEKKEEEQLHKSRAFRRLDRWRQRAIEAETRLKLQQESAPKPQKEAEDGEPTRDQFGTYEEFIEAKAEFRGSKAAERALQQAIKRDQEARVQETHQKQAKEWNSRIDSARDEIDDFDDVCSDSDAPVTQAMSSAIMESNRGPHIAYYLAKNPEEAEKISKLSPSRQVAAIVALEEKVMKPVKTPTKAPAPISPVNKTSSPDGDMPSDKDDIATWMKKEKARMEKQGIR